MTVETVVTPLLPLIPPPQNQVVTTTTTSSSSAETLNTLTSAGKDATLTNSGAIGLRVNDLNGVTSIYDANFNSSADDGTVNLDANGNVLVTNSGTAPFSAR